MRLAGAGTPSLRVRKGGLGRAARASIYLRSPRSNRARIGGRLQEIPPRGGPMRKLLAAMCLPALAVIVLAGCGSSKKSTTASTSTSPSAGVNATIAAEVPAAVKAKGTLIVASEAEYAPDEFIAPDGHTVIGMDPDMVKAIAGVLGLKVKVVNSTFEAIIPGLAAGRYDIGASSFTDTKEREKTVDFVTITSVGEAFLTKASGGPKINTLAELCGHTVAVEKGTTELED